MAEASLIEWTDATWNPITGCTVVSPGCTDCYAMRLAGTRLRNHPSRQGLTAPSKAGPVWNGQVRFNRQWLTQPITWKAPRRIFVCAHGDLFHESVPDEWIDEVFAVMAVANWHTFQVLTKRSKRMRDYMSSERAYAAYNSGRMEPNVYPPPNVWAGVSAEDQPRADERIPDLLATPAAVRFVSIEPMIGPVDLTSIDIDGWGEVLPLTGWAAAPGELDSTGKPDGSHPRIDWVIVGGENGQRFMHPDWARAVRDQCAESGTAFFMKQMGGAGKAKMPPIPDDLMIREFPQTGGLMKAVEHGAGGERREMPA